MRRGEEKSAEIRGKRKKRKRWIVTEERGRRKNRRQEKRQKEDKVDEEEIGERVRKRRVEERGGRRGREELRMQLWVVTASRPVVGGRCSAPGSGLGTWRGSRDAAAPAGAGTVSLPQTQGNSHSVFVFLTQAERSRAQHMHAARVISGNRNDGFQSFGV